VRRDFYGKEDLSRVDYGFCKGYRVISLDE
jgi:hypothetical protein